MDAAMLTRLALAADPGLAAFFLARLAALVDRQLAAADPEERKARGAAIFSVYLDCLDLGLAVEARAIVARLRAETSPLWAVA
jgi:hypothetical protein